MTGRHVIDLVARRDLLVGARPKRTPKHRASTVEERRTAVVNDPATQALLFGVTPRRAVNHVNAQPYEHTGFEAGAL